MLPVRWHASCTVVLPALTSPPGRCPTHSITSDMSKLFCPKCGNATMARLGATIGKNGKVHYHYKKNRRVNTRGTQVCRLRCGVCGCVSSLGVTALTLTLFCPPVVCHLQWSMPKPKGGREGPMLVSEDQLMVGVWKQRAQKKQNIDSFFGGAAMGKTKIGRKRCYMLVSCRAGTHIIDYHHTHRAGPSPGQGR